MSDKWEVVVRSKREKLPNKNKSQVSIVDNKKKVQENVKKQPVVKGHIAAPPNLDIDDHDDNISKNSHKNNQNKKNNPKINQGSLKTGNGFEKPVDAKKIKQAKTLEQCFILIDEVDIVEAYEANVGSNNLARLLDVARIFNSKITADQNDETYSQQPLDYPLSTVPPSLRNILQKYINDASLSTLQAFLELCLSSITNHMIKGGLATGYKIIIQLLGEMNPKMFPKCINKVNALMASYQNRSPIGVSLLWAVGQGGLHDINVGVEVWKQLMVPRIDLRHYVKFVVLYLINILKAHTVNKSKTNRLNNEDVMLLIDFLNTKRKGMPKDLEGLLNNQASVLRKLYFEKYEAWEESENMLEKLLERLPNVYNGRKQLNDITTKEITYCFVEGLRKKDSNYKLWRDLHNRYITQTTYILLFLESNWSTISPTLHKKHITTTLNYFKGVYGDMRKKTKDNDSIIVSHRICQKLTKKATKSRSFIWILGSILLLPIIASLLVVYDVQRNGSFEKSNTGQALQSMGVLEHAQFAWFKGLTYSAKGYVWVENNVPYYYAGFVDFSKPYWELTKDMALIVTGHVCQVSKNVKDYAVEKWPAVQATVDGYVPGFLSAVQQYSATGWNAISAYTISFYDTTSTYLKTKIFIDNWAPEVLHKKTLEALNSTQLYASEYYSWFHKQVDHYSELK